MWNFIKPVLFWRLVVNFSACVLTSEIDLNISEPTRCYAQDDRLKMWPVSKNVHNQGMYHLYGKRQKTERKKKQVAPSGLLTCTSVANCWNIVIMCVYSTGFEWFWILNKSVCMFTTYMGACLSCGCDLIDVWGCVFMVLKVDSLYFHWLVLFEIYKWKKKTSV